MIFRERLKNLSFWFSWLFSIVTIFSSAISARKTNTSFLLFISEKRADILSFFINFFIVNNRFFNIFTVFLKSSNAIESWMTFVATLTTFFSKAENFEYIFSLNCASSLLMRINSRNKNAIKNDDSFRWKEKKKKRRKTKELVVFQNQRKKSQNVSTRQTSQNSKIQSQQQNFRKRAKKFQKTKTRFWLFFSSIK